MKKQKKKVSIFALLSMVEIICGLALMIISSEPSKDGGRLVGQGLGFLVIIVIEGLFYD